MKHGKRPTKAQKIFLKSKRLNYDNWLVVKDDSKEIVILNKESNKVRTFEKAV